MNNSQKKYILIIDYNLSRYDDIKMMTDYAFSRYGLRTILIRPNPSRIDKSIADHVLDLDPRAENFIEKSLKYLSQFINDIEAGLVFSDNAVFSGAKLLASLGIETDSAELAEAAYSKIKYRELESENRQFWEKQNLFIPNYKIIYCMQELLDFAELNPNGFVLKPACEGNNRGVMFLKKGDSLELAIQEVLPYIDQGLICEELIDYDEEYSFDGIAHLSFITKKLSLKSKYPVEYGQIISSKLDTRSVELINKAGSIANLIVGQSRGPFHNEIKLSLANDKAAVIEPNRRPAGMRIWSLAEKVFNINFYHLWLDRVIAKTLPSRLPLSKGIAAIRMLSVTRDGIFQLPDFVEKNPTIFIEKVITEFNKKVNIKSLIEWFDFRFTKQSGSSVVKIQRDNSDFVAQICVYVEDDSVDIVKVLDEFHLCWLNCIDDFVVTQCGEVV